MHGAGGYLVVRDAGPRSAAAKIAVLLLAFLFPPMLCAMGYIVKDALLARLLMFSFGLAVGLRRDPSTGMGERGGDGGTRRGTSTDSS